MAARSAVALLSGGLDSGVGLGLWLEAPGHSVSRCLTFEYGQPAYGAECEAAQGLAARFGLPWEAVALPWLETWAHHAGSALVAGRPPAGTPAAPGDAASAAAVWVPARNLVFLAIAAAYAEAAGDAAILAGFNREEAATFPDNSAGFVAAMDAVLTFATRSDVAVAAPTLGMDKPGIVAEARRLGLGPDDFWSCYRAGPEPCGRCESCLRSARAWQP